MDIPRVFDLIAFEVSDTYSVNGPWTTLINSARNKDTLRSQLAEWERYVLGLSRIASKLNFQT